MVMPLKVLIEQAEQAKLDDEEGVKPVTGLLFDLYSRWVAWFDFYNNKVDNPSIPCTFSYRDRTAKATSQSGFEDYPRASNVNELFEIHLDLQTWMIEFAGLM